MSGTARSYQAAARPDSGSRSKTTTAGSGWLLVPSTTATLLPLSASAAAELMMASGC